MDEPLHLIYKYPLNIGPTIINIPTDSTILKFATQDGKPYVWIEHTDPSENPEYEERKLIMRVTGENWRYKPGFVYMDTIQVGFFVVHIYEDIRK